MGYLTWLDGWVAETAKKVDKAPDKVDKQRDKVDKRRRLTEVEAVRFWAIRAMIGATPTIAAAQYSDKEAAYYAFLGCVLAFCGEDAQGEMPEALRPYTAMFSRQGVKLSPRLVKAFAHARSPQTNDWLSMASERCWYLDIPPRTLMLGKVQVRAIFSQPGPAGRVAAVAVLTHPADDALAGCYSWMMRGKSTDPIGFAGAPVDVDELKVQVTDFYALSLLYFQSLVPPRETPDFRPGRDSGDRKAVESFGLTVSA